MASRKQNENSGRSNKIRFVLVEADISDGNLSELTQAITSALRPAVPPTRQIVHTATRALPPTSEDAVETEEEVDQELEVSEVVDDGHSPAKTTKARKFKPPEYLPDLLAGDKGKAFKEFAGEKAPDNKTKRYLVAIYWLKEHGDSPTVNANKIYTCFKTASWPSGFNDWNQTFHNLVHSEHIRKVGNGEFAINPLGEDSVMKGTE